MVKVMGNDTFIATCSMAIAGKEENEANAQRIVTAVNAHDGLVEALDNLINKDLLKDEYHIQARQALAHAKGEK